MTRHKTCGSVLQNFWSVKHTKLGRRARHIFTGYRRIWWIRRPFHFRSWWLRRPIGLDLFDLLHWDVKPESTAGDTSIEALQRVTILPWRSIDVCTPLTIFQHRIFVADFSAFSYALFPAVAVRVAPFLAEHPPWNLHEASIFLGAAATARRRPVTGKHPVPTAACLRRQSLPRPARPKSVGEGNGREAAAAAEDSGVGFGEGGARRKGKKMEVERERRRRRAVRVRAQPAGRCGANCGRVLGEFLDRSLKIV